MCACMYTLVYTHTLGSLPLKCMETVSQVPSLRCTTIHTHTHRKPVCELRGTQSLLDTLYSPNVGSHNHTAW